jgi:Uma2 family endonuclease
MATAVAKKQTTEYGPRAAGISMTPAEFDHAEFVDGYRYELINGVLVVSPIPSPQERSPNDVLGHWLLLYKETHPQGGTLNGTLFEQTICTPKNRRRADRVIWAGLDHRPRWTTETPTIIAEFVSSGKRNYQRDYEEKRDEYLAMKVGEYWVIERFQRTMTVFTLVRSEVKARVIQEHEVYTTPLLPGFELPVAKLLAAADEFAGANDDEDLD